MNVIRNNSIHYYLPIILLFSISMLKAQDSDANPNNEIFKEWYEENVDISLTIKLRTAINSDQLSGQKSEILFKPDLEITLFDGFEFTAIGRLRSDIFDKLEPGEPTQPEISRLSRRVFLANRVDLELREFYVETAVGRTFLTVGKQQIVWGNADGLKVLDVLNPQDFREFILDDFDESRIPLWALNAEIPIGGIVTQLVWIPDRTYHNIPESEAIYSFTAAAFRPVLSPGIPVSLEPIKRPERFFADSDIGIRLSTFWRGWDLTTNYFYHYQDIPVLFQRREIFEGSPLIVIQPRYERSHLIGGTFANVLGQLTIRGEMGYSTNRFYQTVMSNDNSGLLNTNELTYVLGIDWFGISETFISTQIFQSWIGGSPQGLLRDKIDTNLSLLLRRDFQNEQLKSEVLWVHNANQSDGMIRPKISYELYDNANLWTGLDLFYGNSDGLFGQFDGNDRIVFGVELGI